MNSYETVNHKLINNIKSQGKKNEQSQILKKSKYLGLEVDTEGT